MDNLQIILINEDEITEKQEHDIKTLAAECFSDVTATQDEEHFYAESFARILVYDNDLLVGHLKLFKRERKILGLLKSKLLDSQFKH